MELDCVYGFRGFDCRNNLHYLNDGADIVYHAAGACVVLNLSSGMLQNIPSQPKFDVTFPSHCVIFSFVIGKRSIIETSTIFVNTQVRE